MWQIVSPEHKRDRTNWGGDCSRGLCHRQGWPINKGTLALKCFNGSVEVHARTASFWSHMLWLLVTCSYFRFMNKWLYMSLIHYNVKTNGYLRPIESVGNTSSYATWTRFCYMKSNICTLIVHQVIANTCFVIHLVLIRLHIDTHLFSSRSSLTFEITFWYFIYQEIWPNIARKQNQKQTWGNGEFCSFEEELSNWAEIRR